MKKFYTLSFLLLSAVYSWAQGFTTTGPRTYFGTTSALNTTVYFSFDKGALVSSSDAWDFSLATTPMSSTLSFASGVEGQLLSDTTFAKVTAAPANGYATTISNTFGATGLFTYSGNPKHVIYPTVGKLLLVKLGDGRFVKAEMLSLYKNAPVNILDSSYTSQITFGYISFRYLVSQSGSTDLSQAVTQVNNLLVPASSGTVYKMLNLAIADTTNDATSRWNVRIKGRTVEANTTAGNSAQIIGTAFNDVTAFSTITPNTLTWSFYDGPAGPTGNNGTTATHVIQTLTGKTIVFKDSLGRQGKIAMESYYQNGGAIVCSGTAGYYTFKYYYNPYGLGENTIGRDGEDLTTSATLTQTTFPTLVLSDATVSVGEEGLTTAEEIDVTTTDSWEATTTASWITLDDESATGDGTFSFTTTANTEAARTGEIRVSYCNGAYKVVTVSQDAGTVATSVMKVVSDKIIVYPNPTSDKFKIDLSTLSCNEMSVMNLEGKQVMSITSPSATSVINTQDWNKGIYFLKISSSEGVVYKKIEVQ